VNDDVKAAAERYRNWVNGRGEYMSMGDAGKKRMECDLVMLADAYLAEHPAEEEDEDDEDEPPVTLDILALMAFWC
jgi:hypothetical protein